MQFLQKYENVEKTFWKRWLCERVFFENVSKTFWKRCAIREVFLQRFQKRFGNVGFPDCFFATFPETFWKRSVRFFAPWKENVLKTKKTLGTFLRVAGRTKTRKKNEKKTKWKRQGRFQGAVALLCARPSLRAKRMKTQRKRMKTHRKRNENALKT